MHENRNAAFALAIGFVLSAAWVMAADVIYHNHVPLDAIAFHGLYPLSLAIGTGMASIATTHSITDLACKKVSYRDGIIFPIALAFVLIAIPNLLDVAVGAARLENKHTFEPTLALAGPPVVILLALFEEVMWRVFYTVNCDADTRSW